MSLMVSISGIRGVVGESLTPEVAVKYASAFAEYCKRRELGRPEIVLGRDGRTSGKILANIVSSTLLASGVNVRALGIAPTPTIGLAVERSGAAGGIALTASHNPVEWNGLKFISHTGLFLDSEENRDLLAVADQHDRSYMKWDQLGVHAADDSWIGAHVHAVLSLGYLDIPKIQSRKFRVVVDCINGSGGVVVPSLLRELGCDVIEMNCDMSGVFAHPPEPLPENLTDLCLRVQTEKADLGIAVDPDGDRLVLITEKGEPYGEEYTIATAIGFVLDRERAQGHTYSKSVVVNLSTTRAVDDIAKEFGARVYRTPVGEINVAKKMKEIGAVIGGEGNGGVILPAVHYSRDAIVGIGLIFQMLAEFKQPLSSLKASLPQYAIVKAKIPAGRLSPEEVLDTLVEAYTGKATINTDDGVRVDLEDRWIHVRKSNTEPIVRIIAEASTYDAALQTVEDVKKLTHGKPVKA